MTQPNKVTVKDRDKLLAEMENKLTQWQDQLHHLLAAEEYVESGDRLAYHHQLHAAGVKLDTARQKLETLSLAGMERWPDLSAEVEQTFTELNQDLAEIAKLADVAEQEAMSWEQGLAEKHVLDSIGWAEGFSEEPAEHSIGWAEGLADKPSEESSGWAEGFVEEEPVESK